MMMVLMMVMIIKVVVVFLQGVGSVNWDNVDFIVKDEFSIPCSTLPEPVRSKSFYQSLLEVILPEPAGSLFIRACWK